MQFEVVAAEDVIVHHCNCSICRKSDYQHLIVPQRKFKLKAGEKKLTTYQFNTGAAKHLFCRRCGVKAFYIPRSNPDGYSVNLRCLDRSAFRRIRAEAFDGVNWESAADKLRALSE
ncbi:MAG: GFA family protein [Pseudomonadota bacterium]